MGTKIIGVGSYIPEGVAKNEDFGNHAFYNEDGSKFPSENDVIIEKFKAITGREYKLSLNCLLKECEILFIKWKSFIDHKSGIYSSFHLFVA